MILFTSWTGFAIYMAVVAGLGAAHNATLPNNGCDAGASMRGGICREAPVAAPQVVVQVERSNAAFRPYCEIDRGAGC